MSIIGNLHQHAQSTLQNLLGGGRDAGGSGRVVPGNPFGGADSPRGPGGHSPQLHVPGQGPHDGGGTQGTTGLPSPVQNSGVNVGPTLPTAVADALNQVTTPVTQLVQSLVGAGQGPQPGLPSNPILAPPSGEPQAPFNPASLLAGSARGVGNLSQAVSNTAAALNGMATGPTAPMSPTVVNAVATTVPAVATPQAVTAPAAAAPGQAAAMSATPATAVPVAQGNPAAMALPGTRPGEAAAAPVPGRTDVLPNRADANPFAAARTIAGNPAAVAPGSTVATQAPATQAVPQANTMAVPASQAAGEARGNVVLPGAGGDRNGLPLRPEGQTAIYTLDGLQRKQRRSGVLGGRLDALLQAFGRGQVEVRDVREELLRVTQWLYWILAIVAYASLALALVAFLPLGSTVFEPDARSAVSATSLVIGLGAAALAWWLARTLAPSPAGADDDVVDDED